MARKKTAADLVSYGAVKTAEVALPDCDDWRGETPRPTIRVAFNDLTKVLTVTPPCENDWCENDYEFSEREARALLLALVHVLMVEPGPEYDK